MCVIDYYDQRGVEREIFLYRCFYCHETINMRNVHYLLTRHMRWNINMRRLTQFGTICTILKTKNTHGRISRNFTKCNTLPWVFSRFLNCTVGTKSRKASHIFSTPLPSDISRAN